MIELFQSVSDSRLSYESQTLSSRSAEMLSPRGQLWVQFSNISVQSIILALLSSSHRSLCSDLSPSLLAREFRKPITPSDTKSIQILISKQWRLPTFSLIKFLWKRFLPFSPLVSLPPLRLLHQSWFSGYDLAATFVQSFGLDARPGAMAGYWTLVRAQSVDTKQILLHKTQNREQGPVLGQQISL